MITFDDVRRTDRTTFTFFPDGMHHELTHFLTQAGIPAQEYEIMSDTEAKTRYPGLAIPAVRYDPSLPDVPNAYCQHPNLIVSHMDPSDLLDKIYQIHASREGMEWRRQQDQKRLEGARRQLDHPSHWPEPKE